MPDLSPTIDGRLIKIGTTWANTVNDGQDASGVDTSTASWISGINAIDLSALNATQAERYFIEFDTSGIEETPDSATFKLYGVGNSAADVICVQSSWAGQGSLAVGDWDSWNESSPVTYTNELETWSTSGYNEFTLTVVGLEAMKDEDVFQMTCLEADNDYDQSSAGSGLSISSGYYTRNATDPGKRPVLSYSPAGDVLPPKARLLGGITTLKGGTITIK